MSPDYVVYRNELAFYSSGGPDKEYVDTSWDANIGVDTYKGTHNRSMAKRFSELEARSIARLLSSAFGEDFHAMQINLPDAKHTG